MIVINRYVGNKELDCCVYNIIINYKVHASMLFVSVGVLGF